MAEVRQTDEFFSEDLILLEWDIELGEDEELTLPLPCVIPESQGILLIQSLDGHFDDDILVKPPSELEPVTIEGTDENSGEGRIYQGEVEPRREILARFRAPGLKQRFRAIWAQVKNGISKLAANACPLCKAGVKLIVNYVLTAHGCPTLPGGKFDATGLKTVLQNAENDIRNGRYGGAIKRLASAYGKPIWTAILRAIQVTGWVFAITDAFLTAICSALGFCPLPRFGGPGAPPSQP